jgi:ribonuclease D
VTATPVVRIEDDAALAAWCARARGASAVALDTEFVFERTFWPRPGLVQLAGQHDIALVDALAVADFAPLAGLLTAPNVLKVVHSGSGDALVLERLTGVRPAPLFDTQVAAAYCGLGGALSYAALVELLTGTKLGKHETRTDWTRRPLSPEQLRYAAEDVADLLAVAAELRARLEALGRLGWVLEESAAAVAPDPEREKPENAWRRLRGFDRLPPKVRAIARELARWRELEARARDLPRGFVLADETLVALARRGSFAPAEAKKLPGYDARRHAALVESWRDALSAAEAVSESAPPDEPRAPVLSVTELDRRDRAVAAVVEKKAAELALPPELLLSRRQRDALLRRWEGRSPLSAGLAGFRRALLGGDLDSLFP